jgi:predicted ArsR family transcriptional regulator
MSSPPDLVDLDLRVARRLGATPRSALLIAWQLDVPEAAVRRALFRLERSGEAERVRVPGRYRGTLSKTLHWQRPTT